MGSWGAEGCYDHRVLSVGLSRDENSAQELLLQVPVIPVLVKVSLNLKVFLIPQAQIMN